jgi:hypothetical protein
MLPPNQIPRIVKELVNTYFDLTYSDPDDPKFRTIYPTLDAIIDKLGAYDVKGEIWAIWGKLEPIIEKFGEAFDVCWINTALIGGQSMRALVNKFGPIIQSTFHLSSEQGEDIASSLYIGNLLCNPFPYRK